MCTVSIVIAPGLLASVLGVIGNRGNCPYSSGYTSILFWAKVVTIPVSQKIMEHTRKCEQQFYHIVIDT